jgi:hypothetical protein
VGTTAATTTTTATTQQQQQQWQHQIPGPDFFTLKTPFEIELRKRSISQFRRKLQILLFISFLLSDRFFPPMQNKLFSFYFITETVVVVVA